MSLIPISVVERLVCPLRGFLWLLGLNKEGHVGPEPFSDMVLAVVCLLVGIVVYLTGGGL